MSRIITLARRSYDYVIIDSFPMIDRVIMAVLDLSDQAYIVLESVVPTLLGGARLLRLLNDLGVPHERNRIILNRYMNFAGNLKPADVAQLLGRPVNHLIPYKKDVVIAANMGRPSILPPPLFRVRPRHQADHRRGGGRPGVANGRPPAGFRSNGAEIEPEQNDEVIS